MINMNQNAMHRNYTNRDEILIIDFEFKFDTTDQNANTQNDDPIGSAICNWNDGQMDHDILLGD